MAASDTIIDNNTAKVLISEIEKSIVELETANNFTKNISTNPSISDSKINTRLQAIISKPHHSLQVLNEMKETVLNRMRTHNLIKSNSQANEDANTILKIHQQIITDSKNSLTDECLQIKVGKVEAVVDSLLPNNLICGIKTSVILIEYLNIYQISHQILCAKLNNQDAFLTFYKEKCPELQDLVDDNEIKGLLGIIEKIYLRYV